MKVRIVNVPRRPTWPAWAVALVAGWLILVGVSAWLSARSGRDMPLCLFKAATGKPCPTCGSTRGVLAAGQGRVWQAFAYNPMVFSLAVAAAVLLGMRLLFARAVKLDLTRAERRIAWVLVIAILLANWAYVIAYVG
jgi:hypothetical protein